MVRRKEFAYSKLAIPSNTNVLLITNPSGVSTELFYPQSLHKTSFFPFQKGQDAPVR